MLRCIFELVSDGLLVLGDDNDAGAAVIGIGEAAGGLLDFDAFYKISRYLKFSKMSCS